MKAIRELFGFGQMDAKGFARSLQSKLEDEQYVDVRLGGDTVGVHFYNLPARVVRQVTTRDPLAMRNHVGMTVSGFAENGGPPKSGKVLVEVNETEELPRSLRLRSRRASPGEIAKYIADFVNEVSEEVEPNYRCGSR